MKNYIFLIVMVAFISNISFSQKGQLTNNQIVELKNSFKLDANNIALMNVITANKVRDLVVNYQHRKKVDHEFAYRVKVSGITDQKQSGRCWMFTSMNLLRPKVMEKQNVSSFEFSTNYLYFWDMLEKSNLFLETCIENANKPIDDRDVQHFFKDPIGDGGVWNSFTNLVEKYGLVPANAMPETEQSNSTGSLNRILTSKLRQDGLQLRKMVESKSDAKKIETYKIQALKDVYRILVLHLGIPPTDFQYRFKDKAGNLSELKTYTPMSFYKELFPDINFNDFIMLMDDPSKPYYQMYEIQYDRNVMEGRNWTFINLPASEFKPFALKSIQDNQAMYFSCDVGKQLDKEEGLLSLENYDYESLLGVKFNMDKKERILTGESGSTHGMALVAADVDKNGKITKWQLENSWGANSGNKGYLTMTDEWFDQYMFRIVIHKKYIDQKTLEILKKQPIKLPPWDPMFSSDN